MNAFDVLIIGGGTAGIMVAAHLRQKHPELRLGVVEPSNTHWYQAAWTLVGAGTYDMHSTQRPMASMIPKGVEWVQDAATGFDLEARAVHTRHGGDLQYRFLVVAPGLKIDPSLVKGLEQALGHGPVCSVYTDPEHTWETVRNFKGGTALFTQPTTPIKCGGAPQKVMYLSDDAFRKQGVRENSQVVYATNGSVIFGVEPIRRTLQEVVDRKGIHTRFKHSLVEVDGERQIAWYSVPEDMEVQPTTGVRMEQEPGRVGMHYDLLHLAPPQCAPDFIRSSELVNASGWVDVDHGTLQHNRYGNIFALGDVAGLPTAKTGAAIRKQAPIVAENISRMLAERELSDVRYNGYASCPLVTGYGKMVLAEFDYDNNFTPDPKLKRLLIRDSSKESRRLWWFKKYILPWLYWNKMMKGKPV